MTRTPSPEHDVRNLVKELARYRRERNAFRLLLKRVIESAEPHSGYDDYDHIEKPHVVSGHLLDEAGKVVEATK